MVKKVKGYGDGRSSDSIEINGQQNLLRTAASSIPSP
jgi:hypothetical protein